LQEEYLSIHFMCNYCHDGNGKSTPKPILPSDRYARRNDKGDYKCGVCVGEETERLLNMFEYVRW